MLKSDNLLPSDVKIADPPGRIHISLTALVSGGRWIFASCVENMLILVRTYSEPTALALPEASMIWLDASMLMTRAPSKNNSFYTTWLASETISGI